MLVQLYVSEFDYQYNSLTSHLHSEVGVFSSVILAAHFLFSNNAQILVEINNHTLRKDNNNNMFLW